MVIDSFLGNDLALINIKKIFQEDSYKTFSDIQGRMNRIVK